MIGPKTEIKRTCFRCDYCKTELHEADGIDYPITSCINPKMGNEKLFRTSDYETPDWCPEDSQETSELYVLVAERDYPNPKEGGRPIVFEQYIDQGAASLESVRAFQQRLGDRYGETRIAKLELIDNPQGEQS
jgi:hypothetical protein